METAELPIPAKERYTYEDYAELPEGAPYELISGKLIMAPAPSLLHQLVQSNLLYALTGFVREKDSGTVLAAPVDVRLSDETTVQPDVLFVAAEHSDRIGEQVIDGPPDLIVEILSPASAHRDAVVKKRLYEKHGVPEYWIIDPEGETVELYCLEEGIYQQKVRVVEKGNVSSTLLPGFSVELADLF